MDTSRIIGFRHPSQVELLLDALIADRGGHRRRARRVTERSELPGVLQRMILRARGEGTAWSAWRDGEAIECYVAELIPARVAGEKRPALRLNKYDAGGRNIEFGVFAQFPDGAWRACAVRAGARR